MHVVSPFVEFLQLKGEQKTRDICLSQGDLYSSTVSLYHSAVNDKRIAQFAKVHVFKATEIEPHLACIARLPFS